MSYSEKELVEDLKSAVSGEDMNNIRRKCIETGIKWEEISTGTKKFYASTQSRIHPCPEEYKKNQHVHYDIPHFCRDGEIKK